MVLSEWLSAIGAAASQLSGRQRSLAAASALVGLLTLGAMVQAPAQSATSTFEDSRAASPEKQKPGQPLVQPEQREPQAAVTAELRRSNVPADGDRYVADEVIIELEGTPGLAEVDALAHRHGLERMESRPRRGNGTTVYRWRIPDGRQTADVIRELEADRAVRSVQPNYIYSTQEQAPRSELRAPQYAPEKLHLGKAQQSSLGEGIRIAVINSAIDLGHPELAPAIEDSFDAVGNKEKPNAHGTAVAGLIVGHVRLSGAAPRARILAVHSFTANANGIGTSGTTFNIVRGLDWAVSKHPHVINMSFAGPPDPLAARTLAEAAKLGIVLVAAAGNSGPRSPPLFPGVDVHVIAVAATDASDHLFKQSTPGPHIAVAAPGVDLLVAVPNGRYDMMTGTSFAAPLVSGIVALMLTRNPSLDPATVRRLLMETATDLGSPGRDDQYGAGLVNASRAIDAAAAEPQNLKNHGALTAGAGEANR